VYDKDLQREVSVGLDLSFTTQIKYTLINLKAKHIAFEKVITAGHTSTFSDSSIAIKRFRENIEKFLNYLVLLNVKNKVGSIK